MNSSFFLKAFLSFVFIFTFAPLHAQDGKGRPEPRPDLRTPENLEKEIHMMERRLEELTAQSPRGEEAQKLRHHLDAMRRTQGQRERRGDAHRPQGREGRPMQEHRGRHEERERHDPAMLERIHARLREMSRQMEQLRRMNEELQNQVREMHGRPEGRREGPREGRPGRGDKEEEFDPFK